MWCKNRKKIIKEMKQRGEDPSTLVPPKPEPKPNKPPQKTSQKETALVDRSKNLPRVHSQKELTPGDRGRNMGHSQSSTSVKGKSSSYTHSVQYKDPPTELAMKNSPAKVNTSRSEPFAPYVKPIASKANEQFATGLKQNVTSESYSPVVQHSAPAMPPALLTHPSSASVVSQSTTLSNVKSSSSLPSLNKATSEPQPTLLHTSSMSVPHSAPTTHEPSPEDQTLPLKFMDITQFKAPEDLEEEEKMGEHHRHAVAPHVEPVPPTSSVSQTAVPNLFDPDMQQLTVLLQQGGSIQDVANSLNINLDEQTTELLKTLKQQLDLAATLQTVPVLPNSSTSVVSSQSVTTSVHEAGYSQASTGYDYSSSSYTDTYSSSAYSKGYGQTEHFTDTAKENSQNNSGANLQQGQIVGRSEFSQAEQYSQSGPTYSQAHGQDDTYYSNSSQLDYGNSSYREEHSVGAEPGQFPSETSISSAGSSGGLPRGGSKSFSYGNGSSAADTSTDSMSKFRYGSDSSYTRGHGGRYQSYGAEPRPDNLQQFTYGSDSYSSGIDSDGGIGSGSMNRRRSSNSGTEYASGEGMGRNMDSGPGFTGQGGYGKRGPYGRSESDGAGQGPVSLMGSPPFRSSMGSGSAGFGRQLSDEGTPRGKSGGGGLLGSAPSGFRGGQFGSARGSSQGPRPLMSFGPVRGRGDRGKYRGNWK